MDSSIQEMDELFQSFLHFIKKKVMEESCQSEVTPAQFGVLYHICERDQTSMNELKDMLGLTLGACTGLVDRLCKLDLVARARSETDRRVVYVRVTDTGRELLNKIRARRFGILKEILGQILEQMDPQEKTKVMEGLTLFSQKMKGLL